MKFSKYLFNPFVTKKALMNLLSETALPCYQHLVKHSLVPGTAL